MADAQLSRVLGLLIVGSAASLALGGYLLYLNRMVPVSLNLLTLLAVVVACTISYYVFQANRVAIDVSTILGLAVIAFSASSRAHDSAIARFGSGTIIDLLDVLQVIGFYICPGSFIILRVIYRNRINLEARQSSA